jgi:hypothetical protein
MEELKWKFRVFEAGGRAEGKVQANTDKQEPLLPVSAKRKRNKKKKQEKQTKSAPNEIEPLMPTGQNK